MYPFPPSSFHLFIYLMKKKNINLDPFPLNNKKQEGKKNQSAPFQVPPLHNE